MIEQKYTDLVAAMPVAYALHQMIYNADGEAVDYRFLDVNDAFEAMTGLRAVDVIGKTVLEILPQTETFWIQKYAACIQSGNRFYFENYSQALDKYYQVIAYSPAPEQFITMFLDITEQKIREQKHKESEAILSATMRHSRYSIWSIDRNFKLLYANERFKTDFYQSFGVKLETGIHVIKILPPPLQSIWIERYERAFKNESFEIEDVVDLGTEKIYIEVSTTPILMDGEVIGVSFYGDNITPRKLAEQKIIQNSQHLGKLLNASNQFVKHKSKDVNFDYLIDVLRQISGAKFLVFNRQYADYSKTITLSGLEKTRETIMKYLNIDLTNTKWKREPAFESIWMNNKLTVLPDISSIFFTDFKPAIIQMVKKTFNIGNVAVLRIDGSDEIVGNLVFIYERGKTIENTELIEMFTYQLGQYIERLNAEEALQQKMNEMERFHKLTVNRELNMIELKKEVNKLLKKLGEEEKYRIVGS